MKRFLEVSTKKVEEIVKANKNEWKEITRALEGEKVKINNGRIGWISTFDKELEKPYLVELSGIGNDYDELRYEEFEVIEERSEMPEFETMWKLDEKGSEWIKTAEGMDLTAEFGLRIFNHERFGTFLGADFDPLESYFERISKRIEMA